MLKKGLFKTVPNDPALAQGHDRAGAVDYEHEGFVRAGNMRGSEQALPICLNRLYREFMVEAQEDEDGQRAGEMKRRGDIEERRGKLEKHREHVERIREERLPALRDRIDALRQEIRAIREDPASVSDGATSKASYWIGVLILACLTVYLIVFYSSASYSAFFRVFEGGEIGVANAIFDAQAFGKAFRDGVAEFVLIATMPFVFLGLGFLIHKFQEREGVGKYFKVAALIAVTFVFDAILAYEITHKLADLQALMAFQTPEPYGLADAAQNVQFWLIIFAGFVVYLIWGFVFDFTMEENEKLDAVRVAVRSKQEEIGEVERKIAAAEERAETLELAVANLQTEINVLETQRRIVEVDVKPFKDRVSRFMEGWVHWLKANKHSEETVAEAVRLRDDFLAHVLAPPVLSGDGLSHDGLSHDVPDLPPHLR